MIISILSALMTVGVIATLNSSKASASETDLQTIASALSQYQVRWGDYPPSSLDELGTRAPNGVNNGVESLVACLASRKRGGILYTHPDEMLSNADGDQATKNVTDWYFGDNSLREFTDRFGNVITYLHHRDYKSPKPGVLQYRITKDAKDEVKIEAEKSPATKAYVNPDRFQLRAVGRDGKPGTGDDLRAGN